MYLAVTGRTVSRCLPCPRVTRRALTPCCRGCCDVLQAAVMKLSSTTSCGTCVHGLWTWCVSRACEVRRVLCWRLLADGVMQITWGTTNSHRTDVVVDPQPNRDDNYGRESLRILPANERSQFRWNANPFDMDSEGNGGSEFDAGAWLLPYWMARFYGILA